MRTIILIFVPTATQEFTHHTGASRSIVFKVKPKDFKRWTRPSKSVLLFVNFKSNLGENNDSKTCGGSVDSTCKPNTFV
jgi:hypothetical protein